MHNIENVIPQPSEEYWILHQLQRVDTLRRIQKFWLLKTSQLMYEVYKRTINVQLSDKRGLERALEFFKKPIEVIGLDNFVTQGPMIIASNHLEQEDAVGAVGYILAKQGGFKNLFTDDGFDYANLHFWAEHQMLNLDLVADRIAGSSEPKTFLLKPAYWLLDYIGGEIANYLHLIGARPVAPKSGDVILTDAEKASINKSTLQLTLEDMLTKKANYVIIGGGHDKDHELGIAHRYRKGSDRITRKYFEALHEKGVQNPQLPYVIITVSPDTKRAMVVNHSFSYPLPEDTSYLGNTILEILKECQGHLMNPQLDKDQLEKKALEIQSKYAMTEN